jgi:predicted GNAT family acetyltransferase
LPVACYGAMIDGDCVGFCSANPIYTGITEISWIAVTDGYRRRGLASGLLTAQAFDAFARGQQVAYHAGSAGADLHTMLGRLGFKEISGTYRFIPATAREQWRALWGQTI